MNNSDFKYIQNCLSEDLFNTTNSVANTSYDCSFEELNTFLNIHKVDTLLWSFLKNKALIKAEHQEQAKLYLKKKKAFTLFRYSTFLQINHLLKEKGIQVINFKGILQSVLMYGNPYTRSSKDIDLLIRLEDLKHIDDTLLSLGFECNHNWKGFNKKYTKAFFKYQKELHYVHTKTGINIDIHWKITILEDMLDFSMKEAFESAIEVNIEGKSFLGLSEEHNRSYLHYHHEQDGMRTLSALIDVIHYYNDNPISLEKDIQKNPNSNTLRLSQDCIEAKSLITTSSQKHWETQSKKEDHNAKKLVQKLISLPGLKQKKHFLMLFLIEPNEMAYVKATMLYWFRYYVKRLLSSSTISGK